MEFSTEVSTTKGPVVLKHRSKRRRHRIHCRWPDRHAPV